MYTTEEYQAQLDLLVSAQFSTEQAQAIMQHVEKQQVKSIGELATKRQVADVELTLRTDMEKMEASIRSDMEKMEVSLKHEISDVKKDLSHRMSLQFIALAILIVAGPDKIQEILSKFLNFFA